jgi:uncharacterized protein DUF3443
MTEPRVRRVLTAVLSLIAAACGGGSDGANAGNNRIAPPDGANVVGIVVDSGPPGANGAPVGYVNGAFVTVTVCVPGTANCEAIDHVLVDTGSSGLRLLANDGRAGGQLSLPLPRLEDVGKNAVAECFQFIDGFTWGQVQLADVRVGGEMASGIAIQVIGEAAYPVPGPCLGVGNDEDTLEGASGLLANGILGVGLFVQDCGPACAMDPGSGNPGVYFACSSSASGGCVETSLPTEAQVSNPVTRFATDNNGVIVELPPVPASGAPTASGSLVFGIGTRSNNGLGNAVVIPVDDRGTFTTLFPAQGTRYPVSFIDSGSNGIYFLSSAVTGIATCTGSSGIDSFYCPPSPLTLSAANQGAAGTPTVPVSFSIANAKALFDSNNAAFSNLGGQNAGISSLNLPASFDWGLAFFYGRNVFTAIEGAATPGGAGPYFAY